MKRLMVIRSSRNVRERSGCRIAIVVFERMQALLHGPERFPRLGRG
jgi:hypothetical protein